MTLDEAIAELRAHIEPGRAEGMAAYHKQTREVWGIPNPATNDVTKVWRQRLTVEERVQLAADLWQTDIFEARLAAAKVLTQARIKPDDTGAWDLIQSWVPDFDSWAIADHACMAGQKRLVADPSRVDQVEAWTQSDHMWTRPRGTRDHPALDQTELPETSRTRDPRPRPWLGRRLRHRP